MKIAIIGCGYWGKNLVRNFRDLGALEIICDVTKAGRELAKNIAPEATIVDNLEKVWASQVQGVVIATPAETHYSIGLEALRAGKDVLVEKPLALRYKDGLKLVELAEDNNQILMVGHVLEYHPAILKLLELVKTGTLGEIFFVYSNRLSLGKVRREENILWSFAPHDIAVILRLLQTMPVELVACGGSYVQPNIPDMTVTQMLFNKGIRAHIFVSWLHPFKEQRLIVVGSEKMASFDDVSKELIIYDQHVTWSNGKPIPVKGEGIKIDFETIEPLQQECVSFLESLQSREPPITDGTSGLRVLRVLEAAQKSVSTNGKPVRIPLEIDSE